MVKKNSIVNKIQNYNDTDKKEDKKKCDLPMTAY